MFNLKEELLKDIKNTTITSILDLSSIGSMIEHLISKGWIKRNILKTEEKIFYVFGNVESNYSPYIKQFTISKVDIVIKDNKESITYTGISEDKEAFTFSQEEIGYSAFKDPKEAAKVVDGIKVYQALDN